MNIFTLTPKAKPKAIFLLPEKVCSKNSTNFLLSKLIQPLGLDVSVLAFGGLFVPDKGKIKKAELDVELKILHEYCLNEGINIVAIGNSDYYQGLTGDKKMMLNIGRTLDGIKEFVGIQIVPILNPVILNMFPERSKELNRGISVVKNLISGDYTDPVVTLDLSMNDILNNATDLFQHLKHWKDEPELYVDIETTGLRWYEDKLLTMSFARNDKEAFCIAIHEKYHSKEEYTKIVRVLKAFFTQYKGKLVGHNWVGFDQAFITHEIMRESNFNVPHEELVNMVTMEDSMLLAYVLYNSTERPSIGLKELAFSFMGEYDADVDQKNLYNTDLYKVALYNNYDVIATCRIWKQLQEEEKAETLPLFSVYEEIKNIGISLLKMKMNGLRVNKYKVSESVEELSVLVKKDIEKFRMRPIIIEAEEYLAKRRFSKYNATLKTKKKYADCKEDFYEPFNPGSPTQKQFLFFEMMNLPVVKTSKTSKLPSTDKDVVSEWMELDLQKDHMEILELISEIQTADKVNSTYLKVFESSALEVSPNHWKVFANFNQCGTVSGRLSSSGGLNFQNLPSNSVYGPLVKKLLIADDGFIIGAVDYSALEDRLIAVEANDPNKLRVFTDGIDGHSLNAYAYFRDRLEERGIFIDIDSADSINRIKKEAPDLRQEGKSVTFGLNYGASPKKVAQQLGCSMEEATKIFNGYWDLYAPTRDYNASAVNEARETGAVVSVFSGLRLKMASINAKDEYIRGKEERVAGNFKIQSGNFLTLRRLHEFQLLIEKEKLTEDIFVYNTVHDSIYFQFRDTPETIKWVNYNLISILCKDYKENQALKLEAELDIGYNQKEVITLKNNASLEDIGGVLKELKK